MKKFIAATLLLAALGCTVSGLRAAPDPETGHLLFKKYCIACHGPQGKGDGPVASTLDPHPANLTDKATVGKLSPDQIAGFIRNGRPNTGMLPWKNKLSEDQIQSLAAFVHTLSQP